jgi:hypothetical protein
VDQIKIKKDLKKEEDLDRQQGQEIISVDAAKRTFHILLYILMLRINTLGFSLKEVLQKEKSQKMKRKI